MKGKKMKILIVIIVIMCGLFILGGGYFILSRYYFYNQYNIHAQNAIKKMLNYKYDDNFVLISTEYEAREQKTGGARYIHVWTFTFADSNGKEFNAYLWGYGVREKLDGNYHAADYSSYSSDTYGQVCIEDCMDQELRLSYYRQIKNSKCPDVEDYVFVCEGGNESDIAKILTQIYFEESKISRNGCLECLVKDERGESLFVYSYVSVSNELQELNVDITEGVVWEYIINKLKK